MPRVWGYIRVSTEEQANEGFSLAEQERRLLDEYAYRWEKDGYEWGGVTADRAVTAGKPFLSRKGGAELAAKVEKGDVVIFPKLDRGFRSTRDVLNTVDVWAAMGVRMVFLDMQIDLGTAVGELMMTILAGFATFERKRLQERIKAGLDQRRREGKLCHRPPWGTRVYGKKGHRRLVVDEDALSVGAKIVEWRNAGYDWEAIDHHLRKLGVRKPRSKKDVNRGTGMTRQWTESMIQRAYCGTLRLMQMISDGKVQRLKPPAATEPGPVQ